MKGLALALLLVGCTRTTNLVSSRADDAAVGVDARVPDATTPITNDAGIVLCGDAPCACGNGLDDDGDGLVDGFDPECTGAYDQDEASFATGEVKEGNPNCADCFFDGNPSANDDGCRVATQCSVDGTSSGAPGSCGTCAPSSACLDACLPRTPNGCDCFGCCEVQGRDFAVRLADTCSMDDIADEERCPRCVINPACFNPCGACELCPGRTQDQLDGACGTYTCDEGPRCEATCNGYCVQGCCAPVL